MKFLDLALEEAKKAYDIGEIPVGAVIVKDGIVVSKAYNLKESKKQVTAHAEILAITKANEKLGDWRLNDCEMYVTLEPCAMCAGAIAQARISKLYIGSYNLHMGSCGTVMNIYDYDMFNHKVEVLWLNDDDCSKILKKFFKNKKVNNTIDNTL